MEHDLKIVDESADPAESGPDLRVVIADDGFGAMFIVERQDTGACVLSFALDYFRGKLSLVIYRTRSLESEPDSIIPLEVIRHVRRGN